MNEDFLLEINSDPRYTQLISEILKQRPVVPLHNPRNDNTEEWKAKSAEQRGFDIWLTYLKIEVKHATRTNTD
jgi:hypothetical protein